jgi:hypothetical protein
MLKVEMCTGVLTVLSWEQRLAAEHLSQNAAHTPHIDSLCVLLECKHNFRGTVPSRSDVFCHETRVVLGRRGRSCETKVADLQIAVGVQKQVGGLEIAVEDVRRVHGFECAQRLVDEVLTVVVGQLLCADNTVHVGFHEFLWNALALVWSPKIRERTWMR